MGVREGPPDHLGLVLGGDHVAVGLQRPPPRLAGQRLGVHERPVAIEDDPAQARKPTYQGRRSALCSCMTPHDARSAWELARDEAHLAFHHWCHAPQRNKRDAYTAYRAAADREDLAAAHLEAS